MRVGSFLSPRSPATTPLEAQADPPGRKADAR
jgi:hypothetical protein